MIGILVQLAISWLIIYFIEKKNLNVLGFWPTRRRLTDFIFFLFLTSICCASGFVLKIIFLNQYWQVNPEISFSLIWKGIVWNFNSALFEELIFRGVLLYIAIKRLGEWKGMLLSSAAFGIYHWFSFNAFGNAANMIFIFVYTGVMGIVFAYAYAKSGSLYIPIAIHLGWGIVQQVIFSSGPIGDQMLVRTSDETGADISQALFFSIQFFAIVFTPPFLFFILRHLNQRERWRVTHNSKLN